MVLTIIHRYLFVDNPDIDQWESENVFRELVIEALEADYEDMTVRIKMGDSERDSITIEGIPDENRSDMLMDVETILDTVFDSQEWMIFD